MRETVCTKLTVQSYRLLCKHVFYNFTDLHRATVTAQFMHLLYLDAKTAICACIPSVNMTKYTALSQGQHTFSMHRLSKDAHSSMSLLAWIVYR